MSELEMDLLSGIAIGSDSLPVIAGPCVIESEEQTLEAADAVKAIGDRLGLGLVFKASYDKANRSSARSFRGPGLTRGLEILAPPLRSATFSRYRHSSAGRPI